MKRLTTIQIDASRADNPELRLLYETAFPKEEQIPYDELLQLMGVMPLDYKAYYIGESLVGFTIVLEREVYPWFWYFAVAEELRGCGYGQQILSALIEDYANRPLILDIESPLQVCANSEQRRRRHAFYLRNGFRDTGVGKSFEGIDYTILMAGEGSFTQTDYDALINELKVFWENMPDEGERGSSI